MNSAMIRSIRLLFIGGVALAGLAGATGRWGGYAGMSLVFVGVVMMIAGCWLNGFRRPSTALFLIACSNGAFWLSYLLWQWLSRSSAFRDGNDPYVGLVALWLILLSLFSLVEALAFLKGLKNRIDRKPAVVGIVALAAQVHVTMRCVYRIVEGV